MDFFFKRMYALSEKQKEVLFMERNKRLCRTGFITFFLSGICAIASGVIVSILQDKYNFSYGVTGTMLSFMSIGNMAASFATGLLPKKIGTKWTAAILCSGYFLGYLCMTLTGIVGVLIAAFALVGIAKGCALNNCTVLVGNNSEDRTKGMSLMHACYACGALLCPFLASGLLLCGVNAPMLGLALLGLLMWVFFMTAGLPGKPSTQKDGKSSLDTSFLKSSKFWLLTGLVFCQNAAETSVTGWLVTYYKNSGILSGSFAAYTVTVMWGATLIARLLIAFVFPIKNTFRALSVMGFFCTLLYGALIFMQQPVWAIIMLFAFAFAMAGVNPVAVAGVGRQMNATSMGVLLPIASIGAIVMPWFIGILADKISLQAGMISNLIPCAGILILSMILQRKKD